MLENILKEKQKIHHKINNIKSVLELLWQGAGQEADTADQPRPESRLRNQFQKISAPVKYNQIKSYKVCLNWMNLRSASRSWCTNKIERFFHVCRLKCPDELKCGDAVPPASVCVFIPGGGGLRGGLQPHPDRTGSALIICILFTCRMSLSWVEDFVYISSPVGLWCNSTSTALGHVFLVVQMTWISLGFPPVWLLAGSNSVKWCVLFFSLHHKLFSYIYSYKKQLRPGGSY